MFIEVTADLFHRDTKIQFQSKPSDVSNCIFLLACIQSIGIPVVMREKSLASLMSHEINRRYLMENTIFSKTGCILTLKEMKQLGPAYLKRNVFLVFMLLTSCFLLLNSVFRNNI